ncbi:hypothetical protein Lal_00027524 [Lupinus albus]|nr:hypothetical protein Lal_00027524 [Lupinus albus]
MVNLGGEPGLSVGLIGSTMTYLVSASRRELLEIKFDNCISEETRVLFSVTLRHINYIRFQNNGPDLTVTVEPVNRGDGAVISESVFASSDAETSDVSVIV